MARMMANARRDRSQRECDRGCCTIPDRFTHGGRKDPRFRKIARAADKGAWKKEDQG